MKSSPTTEAWVDLLLAEVARVRAYYVPERDARCWSCRSNEGRCQCHVLRGEREAGLIVFKTIDALVSGRTPGTAKDAFALGVDELQRETHRRLVVAWDAARFTGRGLELRDVVPALDAAADCVREARGRRRVPPPHEQGRRVTRGCQAGRDGECNWSGCPQERDGEPAKSGRHCPRDTNGVDRE